MTSPDARVLLLPLTAKDGATTHALLASAGIEADVCRTFGSFLDELRIGAAAALVAEEQLAGDAAERLAAFVREQPAWSDLPLLLLTRHGADSATAAAAVRTLGNVTLLERPLRMATLLSAVRTAVRARERQYQIRSYVEERERSAEALAIADQRKDEFLAMLGHELRNPLAPLVTGLELLRMNATRGADFTNNIMAVMERQVAQLVRLVDDLLEVSRITRGVITMRYEPVELRALLHAAADTTRPLFDAAHHHLTIDVPDTPIMVSGDAVRLTQVFANLLTNAAKYTNAGGRVQIRVRAADGRVVVAVRDNGIGIAPADLGSVFDMFKQVDPASQRSQGGLGIGLTLVRGLVSMHGGTIEARSAGLGAGSEFVVTLPLHGNAALPAAGARHAKSFPRRRVLVVDDNRDAADTLGALLESLGTTVQVAYGGNAALEAVESFDPDTVLLDLGMPVIDGYEVARRIRASSGKPRQALLIALTGWGQDQDLRRSEAAGFDHHLVKPPDLDKLREIMTRH
jgi:signal transduction histidine kinase/CheY-like chemotaxis protein